MAKIKDFIANKKPHVIAVSGTNRDANFVMEDLRAVVTELEQEQQMAPINVELVDNELSQVYANCKKGEVGVLRPFFVKKKYFICIVMKRLELSG